jgi:NAD(P)-dependent dehydrogenase (short-subunit alcohol dehydrogenase family)
LSTVLITGASSGIGEATARRLAREGHRLLLACRDAARTSAVAQRIRAECEGAEVLGVALDLGQRASVLALAAELTARGERIDVLLNNGGVYSPMLEMVEGCERTFAINYLGHYLLSLSLLPCLTRAEAPRIINVASNAHLRAKGCLDDLCFRTRAYDSFQAYACSKLAVVMGTVTLAERLAAQGISVLAVHPGHASTNIWPREGLGWRMVRPVLDLFLISADQGAEPCVQLVQAPSVRELTGAYFDRMAQRAPHPLVNDGTARARLETETHRLLGLEGG